ncbi:hypothetical protein N7468_001626 [Penicillium chermesinum]|uniref:Uncharacterized protein n=1 Tax=Penicillium chermesinum TaxID=63820 RepID=A0A9W9PJ57_9EURO|nr:uncharacterized protein N7468_001626 [Penicillium chermesinum]KAJ5246643.1 hypothetical protein N7468_001626 [Penicillium chermesinum]KAJ6144915.1 hypothetical protein N7470_008810 [Penicillium chermesinum]
MLHGEGARSSIGGPGGPQPNTINDRLMSVFGCLQFRYPLLATDSSINAAKGRIVEGDAPTALDEITKLAKLAIESGSVVDTGTVLSNSNRALRLRIFELT